MVVNIKMYGADWCGDTVRAKRVLQQHDVSYDFIDLVAHPEEKKTAEDISGRPKIPVLLFPDGSFLSEPSNQEIEEKLQ